RSPIAGRLCRMNASVSIVLPGCCDFASWAQPRGESVSKGAQLVNRGARAVGGWSKTCDSCASVLRAPTPVTTPVRLSLLQRLDQGPVVCAEGYVFELERRGYLQAGAFVPEVVLEHPEVVAQLHRDFVHAGSDVVEALTYYAHREKLRIIGRAG